jgi:hypothetical protein
MCDFSVGKRTVVPPFGAVKNLLPFRNRAMVITQYSIGPISIKMITIQLTKFSQRKNGLKVSDCFKRSIFNFDSELQVKVHMAPSTKTQIGFYESLRPYSEVS